MERLGGWAAERLRQASAGERATTRPRAKTAGSETDLAVRQLLSLFTTFRQHLAHRKLRAARSTGVRMRAFS